MSYAILFGWATFIYFAAFVFYLFRIIINKDLWGRLATLTVCLGIVVHAAAFLLRWKVSYDLGIGHIPLSNFYESLTFFAWAIAVFYVLIEWRNPQKVIGAFVMPFSFLSMAYASLVPGMNTDIQPLVPALQSNWLTTHVVSCFLGYAGFTIAFGCALIFFVKKMGSNHPTASSQTENPWKTHLPSFDTLDMLIYQSTALGFVLLTVGIMTGSVWAHYAWGTYWSWDPKETWSLITWIIYAIMLHTRLVRGWHLKRMAALTIIGFASVLFTYLGVNYLPGLHSYLK
jgi:cytochrome c-type biogenesis protein CcsB